MNNDINREEQIGQPMKCAQQTGPTLFVTVFLLGTIVVHAQEEWHRKGIWEIYGSGQYLFGDTVDFSKFGARLKVDDTAMFGLGAGYNLRPQRQSQRGIQFSARPILATAARWTRPLRHHRQRRLLEHLRRDGPILERRRRIAVEPLRPFRFETHRRRVLDESQGQQQHRRIRLRHPRYRRNVLKAA